MRVVAGDLTGWADGLRARLIRAGALIEASLDFADEEVPEEVPGEVFEILAAVRVDILDVLAGYPAAERLRAGFEVAIVGPPNVGKSSLLNRIGRRDLALVSDIAGTTRDVIELHTELGGLAVTFLDTAGLRDSADMVEQMGVQRARDRAANADLRLHLTDGVPPDAELLADGDLIVRSKSDLGPGDVSAKTGDGVDELLDLVRARLADRVAGAGFVSRRRQAEALKRTADGLVELSEVPEVLAEQMRIAVQAIAEVVGRVAPDDYLDEIFASFCIGK